MLEHGFYNMDCIEGMKQFPDNYFGLAIVDPPYGLGDFAQSDSKFYGKISWNDSIPSPEYFEELKRVSKRRIIWGANYFNCFETGGAVIWDKKNKHPDMSTCEIASLSFQRKVDLIELEHYGFRNKDGKSIHPCQKPVALYRRLLMDYAKPDDIILDTHVGSASSLIACEMEGYEYVGFELDKEYYERASKRLKAFKSQLTLFDNEEYKNYLIANQ